MSSKRNILTAILVFRLLLGYSSNTPDSLLSLLRFQRDTNLERTLCHLADYFQSDLAQSKKYALRECKLADSLHFAKGQVEARNKLGLMALDKAQYDTAIVLYQEAIHYWENTKRKPFIIILYTRLAIGYYLKGDYELALKAYIKADDYGLKMNRKDYLTSVYMGMGNIYFLKKNFKIAQDYYKQALSIATESNNQLDKAELESCLGNISRETQQINAAILHYQKALSLYDPIQFSQIATCKMNLGNCYADTALKNFDKALVYYKDALAQYIQVHDFMGELKCNINIGSLLEGQHQLKEAIPFYQKSLKIAKDIGSKEMIVKALEGLANLNGELGNFHEAFEQRTQYVKVLSSLLDSTSAKNLNELQTKFNVAKKDLENQKLTQENQAKAERLKQDKIINGIFLALIALGVFTIGYMFVQFRQKKKANAELENRNHAIRRQKHELENQKGILEVQHREITDSINYAKQIQQAILPSLSQIKFGFPRFFLLYEPKAVVSGDFYYFAEVEKGFILAAVDCTGHGVPGAFMSMIGHNLLAQVIKEASYYHPDEILNNLHQGVRAALQQDKVDSQNRDGMDMALLYLSRDRKILEFAGANRPVYWMRNNQLTEIKGDKFPIGGLQDEHERVFNRHTLEVSPGDRAYIFSDGFADQFGGPKGKKYMVKNFQNEIIASSNADMEQQGIYLHKTFLTWKGDLEQVDDILVIGVEV